MSGKPSNYRRIYPNQEAITFDGGLDNKFEVALIPNNDSPDCLNVIFDDGAVGTRDGSVKLNTAAAGTSVVFDGVYSTRRNDASETMVVFAGGHMYTLNATTFITVPSAQSVFTAGVLVGTAMQENYLFIGNGGVNPYKWDGSLFTRHGVQPPTATATVATSTTGSLTTNGVYLYKYTYVNTALVESDVGPVSATFTVGAAAGYAASLTAIGLAPTSFGINARRIYRTATSGTTYFLVTTLNDNTTTTYSDVKADANLGAAAPTDNGLPPKYNAILYHSGRLFMNDTANPNLVWYTNLNTPYTVASTNFFKIGDNTSDLVRGFAVYNNSLYIFCDNSIWINFMVDPSTPSTWRQLKSLSPFGSMSPYCLLNMTIDGKDVVLFPAIQNKKFVGFAAATGDTIDPSSTQLTVTTAGSQLMSDVVQPDMFNVQFGYVKNISGIVFKNKAYITLSYGAGQTTNNRMYCFDFTLGNLQRPRPYSWVPFTGLNGAQLCVYSGNLYFGSSTTSGFVYRMGDTGVYSDDGAAINSYFWTKEFQGFDPDINFMKDFRYANILVDLAGAYYMNINYRTDSDSGAGNYTQINLDPGGSKWGTMIWGVNTWGGGANQSEPRVYLGALRGKRIQFKFSNQNIAGQRFKAHRMNFAYNVKGFR